MLKGIICNKWNVLLLAGALAPLALHGDTIFSNVTGTQPTGELTASYPQEYAEAFTPTANYSMTDAEVFIAYANADLFLYTNNSGVPRSRSWQAIWARTHSLTPLKRRAPSRLSI